jgi:HEAT repeat protein
MNDVGHEDRLCSEEISDEFFTETSELLAARALNDDDPLIRKHAIYLLGISRNPDHIETFVTALKDPEKLVRSQATRSLAGIGKPASERLIALLHDPDWKVRYRAAEALGLMRDKQAIIPLIQRLSDEEDHVRYMATKALGEMGAPEVIDPISQLFDDENPHVRKMADNVSLKLKS